MSQSGSSRISPADVRASSSPGRRPLAHRHRPHLARWPYFGLSPGSQQPFEPLGAGAQRRMMLAPGLVSQGDDVLESRGPIEPHAAVPATGSPMTTSRDNHAIDLRVLIFIALSIGITGWPSAKTQRRLILHGCEDRRVPRRVAWRALQERRQFLGIAGWGLSARRPDY